MVVRCVSVFCVVMMRICSAQFISCNHILIFVCNLFNYIINKNMCVFAFKTRIDVILKMSITVFKHLFCVINNFSSNSFFNLFVNLCQIIDAYVIVGFTAAEYICLIFEKKCFSCECSDFQQRHALRRYFYFHNFNV